MHDHSLKWPVVIQIMKLIISYRQFLCILELSWYHWQWIQIPHLFQWGHWLLHPFEHSTMASSSIESVEGQEENPGTAKQCWRCIFACLEYIQDIFQYEWSIGYFHPNFVHHGQFIHQQFVIHRSHFSGLFSGRESMDSRFNVPNEQCFSNSSIHSRHGSRHHWMFHWKLHSLWANHQLVRTFGHEKKWHDFGFFWELQV